MRSNERERENGFLVVNKPPGVTSHDVVDRVRKRFRYRRVGHAGTLDPTAEGVLVLGLGRKATRNLGNLMVDEKEYRAVMVLGVRTDSQDAAGTVVERGDWHAITEADVGRALERFRGVQLQVPPMHSALKYGGKPLYKLAREGKVVPRKARSVHVYEIELLDFMPPEVRLRLRCSKGTYVRTICSDIGDALGCGAYLKSLVRTRSGRFTLDGALPLETVLGMSTGDLAEKMIPVESSQGPGSRIRESTGK
jgi:tRNA pseudouridine55 synthase